MPKRKTKPIRAVASVRRRAKELRRQPTTAEKILWEELRDRRLFGLKFRRQHPLGTYIADFYCPANRLIVEIDGDIHRFQRENDQIRTNQLEEKGFKIIRFWNYEVEDQLDTVLGTIAENCDLPSPKFGRRACPESSEGVGDEGNNENLD